MSLATNISDLATRIGTEFKAVYGKIGNLTNLATTAKTDLVSAINEIAGSVGEAGAQINDTTTSTLSVWSSSKTDTEIGSRVAAVVDAAPGTLDTLNELAAALGDDANFATTTSTALGNRLRFDAVQTLTAPQQAQGLTNLGAAAATHSHASTEISDSTATGRSVLTATDAAAARTAIGAGTSNLAIGTTSTTAKAGDYQPSAANITDSTATGRAVITATDAAAARTAIGAGTSNLVIGTTSTTAKAGDYSPPAATDLAAGIVELATTTEATTGTDTTRAVTPAGLKTVADTKANTSHTHTAANISDSTATGRSVLTATDAAAARSAIGAGTSNLAIGTTAGTAKAGDYAPPAATDAIPGLVELATTTEATTGTDTVRAVTPAGLKTVADTKANTSHTHTAANISDSTTTGRSVLTATDAAAARTAIGAGTSSLVLGTTAGTAKAGDYQPTAANISDSTLVGRSVITAIDAPAARTAIGAGTSNLVIGTAAGTAADAAAVGDTTTNYVTVFEAALV